MQKIKCVNGCLVVVSLSLFKLHSIEFETRAGAKVVFLIGYVNL